MKTRFYTYWTATAATKVLQYAKDIGMILFCFPAHCTHRLQPLDVGFFHLSKLITTKKFRQQHPGRIVTHFQVAGLFNKAYLMAATPANAVHAFAKTGIYDWMFQLSSTTDRPNMTNAKMVKNNYNKEA
ncbi:hypothetical protein Zmor_011205 [Zophobas morio]|uniref:DDE-1 domain-containing protein n=1 Tax=Zophobas morio TaxID=2755281 RepID=A0AA38IQK4_9CUCU|nr:hypothetical protein Zmor_011205 [Zophobas morio]